MRAYEFIQVVNEASQPLTTADRIAGVESGNRHTAVNKLSGATGTFQMMPNTFKGLVAKAKPGDPLYKASWEQHRNDPQLQRAAFDALSAENDVRLQKAGIPLTDTNRYIAHYLGGPKAAQVLKDPDANLGKYLGKTVFKQNPNIKPDMKVSDMTAQFDKKLAAVGTTKPTQVAAATAAQTAAMPAQQVAAATPTATPQKAAMPAKQVAALTPIDLTKSVGASNDPYEKIRQTLDVNKAAA